ncbi:hypothetical protein ACFY30_25655 [Streptomyces sp. NPDC000345]|uniref:hypothetical protein n=1 Tax=Streptomyces sp. NPDC000345 TaxID=3364537 RepID=UPI00367F6476
MTASQPSVSAGSRVAVTIGFSRSRHAWIGMKGIPASLADLSMLCRLRSCPWRCWQGQGVTVAFGIHFATAVVVLIGAGLLFAV